MKKINFVILGLIFSQSTLSAEPDESGIGGTGAGVPEVNELIFNRPDTPEVIEILDIDILSETKDLDSSELSDIPADMDSSASQPANEIIEPTP